MAKPRPTGTTEHVHEIRYEIQVYRDGCTILDRYLDGVSTTYRVAEKIVRALAERKNDA